MRFTIVVPALFACLMLAAPAAATDPVTPTAPAAAKPEMPKKICRRAEEQSSSRIGSGRVCKTAEEWASADTTPGNQNRGRAVRSTSAE